MLCRYKNLQSTCPTQTFNFFFKLLRRQHMSHTSMKWSTIVLPNWCSLQPEITITHKAIVLRNWLSCCLRINDYASALLECCQAVFFACLAQQYLWIWISDTVRNSILNSCVSCTTWLKELPPELAAVWFLYYMCTV